MSALSSASATHHYNPGWADDDTALANFVARHDDFAFLRFELARVPREGSAQHHLLVGLRGAGKTTLLKRVAVAIRRDADLRDHLVALSFPEELYQVKNLADFWWACCEALADELDSLGLTEAADQLAAAMNQARGGNPADPLSGAGLQCLLQACARLGRRPVLLVDNLDMVLQRIDKTGRKLKDPHSPAYWALREALSTTTSPVVIGGSTRLSEPFTGYDKAFYDFFMPRRLGKLGLQEAHDLLNHLADARGVPEVRQRLKDRPSRIEALYELTGGNPRALGLIFELLRQGPNSRALEDFERLMDITTPYYKARFEDLSEQAQVVMHALATNRPGAGGALRFGPTAAETAIQAGLPTGTVSAQLDMLEKEGLVEKNAEHGRTQYRMAEQLFRLWLQMRGNRRLRQNVMGLTRFLEAMFSLNEMEDGLRERRPDGQGTSPLDDARYAFAMADMSQAQPMRRGLEALGADRLLAHTKTSGGALDEHLRSDDLPVDLNAVVRLRDQLQRCAGTGLPEAWQQALLGSVTLTLVQKQLSVRALCEPATAQAERERIQPILDREQRDLLRFGMQQEDLPRLFRKRTLGLVPLPYLTPQDAEEACLGESDHDAVACRAMVWHLLGARLWVKVSDSATAEAWLIWGRQHAYQASATAWANVAGTLRRCKQFDTARQALETAAGMGETARGWHERAALLLEQRGDPSEAVVAYRKAIELDPADAFPWNNLGDVLAGHLKCHEEAEEAYRKAIELDPEHAFPWNNLGIVLDDPLKRHEEAEAAYRKATELDPAFAAPWNNLGIVLAFPLARHEEAEAALRKAIELDPAHAAPWSNLGRLLAFPLARHEEAEAALRKAIELDPKEPRPWQELGELFREQGRLAEAGLAYAKGNALDLALDPYWQRRHMQVQTRLWTQSARLALQADDLHAAREALHQLLAESVDIAAAAASPNFVEEFLVPLLTNASQARSVLGLLRDLGYAVAAQPLLLALEAAVEGRRDMLDVLVPEVKKAALRMYERLTRQADTPSVPTKTASRRKAARK